MSAARWESRRNACRYVSTGSRQITTTTVAATSATIEPGTRFANRRKPRIKATEDAANTSEATEYVSRWLTRARMRPIKSPGIVSIFRPQKSLICVLAISTAMPLVKPIVTGRGMNLTIEPSPVSPSSKRITPASIVQTSSPSSPC